MAQKSGERPTPAEVRARKNSEKALKTLEKVLREVKWDPQPTGEEGQLLVDFTADRIPIANAIAAIRMEFERFVFYLNFAKKAPPLKRDKVAELITRVNCGLIIGNFEMRYKDGAVRFKSSVDFTGVELTEPWIRNAIQSAMDVVEEYADAVVRVMAGKATVREVLADEWDE